MSVEKHEELLDEESQVVDSAAGGNGLSTQGGATVATGQKRLRDDHGAPASKKAHIVDSEETVQVKILIPSAAVGAIIGKGGETMRNLKSESGCRLQMSKNQEVYHEIVGQYCELGAFESIGLEVVTAVKEACERRFFNVVVIAEATYGTPNKDLYSNGSGGTFKFNPMQGLGNQEVGLLGVSFESFLKIAEVVFA
ncbi:unnamed protein product [Toxocara canis]|uniref:KH domain-containing protein n=1 Tax=Toxocara canis TaxID=6265 RepID=A0A183V307_TOXCA|nr:unnamed protein product [Toxocara canis]